MTEKSSTALTADISFAGEMYREAVPSRQQQAAIDGPPVCFGPKKKTQVFAGKLTKPDAEDPDTPLTI